MIRIAIIDDEILFVKKVQEITGQYFKSRRIEYELVIYLLSGELLWDVEKGEYFDIYLIDIEMPVVSGMDIACAIREKYDEPYIMFVTSHLEYSIRGYEYGVWRYITKDTLYEKLPLAFDGLISKLNNSDKRYYMIDMCSRVCRIECNDIYYFHKDGKYTIFHAGKGILRERKAITKIYNELNQGEFLFANRTYVVNLRHVMSLSQNTVTMRDGTDISVSAQQFHKVKKEFNDFWKGNI